MRATFTKPALQARDMRIGHRTPQRLRQRKLVGDEWVEAGILQGKGFVRPTPQHTLQCGEVVAPVASPGTSARQRQDHFRVVGAQGEPLLVSLQGAGQISQFEIKLGRQHQRLDPIGSLRNRALGPPQGLRIHTPLKKDVAKVVGKFCSAGNKPN